MQAAVMNQPVMERTAYDDQKLFLAARVMDHSANKRVPPHGFSSFVVRQEQEDELNNGDPPDVMLWGEES